MEKEAVTDNGGSEKAIGKQKDREWVPMGETQPIGYREARVSLMGRRFKWETHKGNHRSRGRHRGRTVKGVDRRWIQGAANRGRWPQTDGPQEGGR